MVGFLHGGSLSQVADNLPNMQIFLKDYGNYEGTKQWSSHHIDLETSLGMPILFCTYHFLVI